MIVKSETYKEIQENLLRVTHRSQLVDKRLLTFFNDTSGKYTYFGEFLTKEQKFSIYRYDTVEMHGIESFEDSDKKEIFEGAYINGVTIQANFGFKSVTLENVKVKYKAYSENIGTVTIKPFEEVNKILQSIAENTIKYYNEMVNQKTPEVHIIGVNEIQDTQIEDTVVNTLEKDHSVIMKEYHNVVAEISDAAQEINRNTKLEDIADLQDVFIKTREKLKELSSATVVKSTSIFDKFKGIPLIGKVIASSEELKQKTESVQDHIDAMFITVHKQYNRLVEIGEGLQRAKKKQETQVGRLEALIMASDAFLATFSNPSEVPVRDLSSNNQIKVSYEKLKKRILKTEAAIMGTQASIISLGKNLPTCKAEMVEELAISGLLNSVTDYQKMYQEVSELVNEVVTATSEKTYQVVENLMELQLNDTHTINYLSNDTKRAKEFALMLTDKAQKLADKVQKDAVMIKEVAGGSSILEARAKIKALGYDGEMVIE